MVVGMICMGKERTEIVPVFFDIFDLAHMTLVEIQVVVGDDLIDTFFSKLVHLSGLNLHDRSFLFGGINFRVLGVYVHCPEEHIAVLREQISDKLEDAQNFVFIR